MESKRNLRVTEWLSSTPAVAVCAARNREFSAPMLVLTKTEDGQVYLQRQFDEHNCECEDATA
jgi:hypothetical protein